LPAQLRHQLLFQLDLPIFAQRRGDEEDPVRGHGSKPFIVRAQPVQLPVPLRGPMDTGEPVATIPPGRRGM